MYLIIILLGYILLFYFSQPNRLSHDEIDHKEVMIAEENPEIFKGDYILGNEKYKLVDNYYSFQLLKWLSARLGGDEITRWILVGIVFAIFTIGMYELLYYFTGSHLISLGVAVASNIHISPVFVSEWGLPGPRNLDPWTFAFAFYPAIFLMFYKGMKENKEGLIAASFFLLGLLGNLHIITVFNILGIFLLTYIFQKKYSASSLIRAAVYGITSLVLSLPFLLRHYGENIQQLTTFDPKNPDYVSAIRQWIFHVTLEGRLFTIKQWLVDEWYVIWPFLAIFIFWIVYNKRYNKQEDTNFFEKFSINFIIATLVFNFGFSAIQVARLYIFHQFPIFNEPRGVQLMYIIFFISLASVLNLLWKLVSKSLGNKFRPLLLISAIILSVIGLYFLYPTLRTYSKQHTSAQYTFDTCDAEMYRELKHYLREGDIILLDPDLLSTIRICVRHPIVVERRDVALAYSVGSDIMLEWIKRYRDVKNAYEIGGDALLQTARKYNARVVVSRQCKSVDLAKLELYRKVPNPQLGNEGCIYILK